MSLEIDSCCRKVADLLCQHGQSSPRTLARLVEKSGLARSTVLAHIKHLKAASLISKEEVIVQGKVGRPQVLYKASPALLQARTE